MHSTRDLVRTLPLPAAMPVLASAPSRVTASLLTRAGLPVVSNRAFISDWASRRNRLVAAARVVRSN